MKLPGAISVFGLGKLGLPFAVTWASRGFRVIGVDEKPELVKAIASGSVPHAEHPVSVLLKRARSRISVTHDPGEATEQSDASFVIVPTPSDANGGFSTGYVEEVLEAIGKVIRSKNKFHLVTVVSTVLPGASESVFKPLLERVSGKACGKDFGLCYNPEFIALGDVVSGLLTPDLVLIGESDPYSGELLSRMYKRFCKNDPPIARMSFWNAELAKISLNVFVTMKISFANTLAALCEHGSGGDVDVVLQAIGLDSRIGRKYLKGGLGYGGPCFPRDNRAFSYVAGQLGTGAKLSQATDRVNIEHSDLLSRRVVETLHGIESPRVAILGLTYKPNTFVVEESAALNIAKTLAENGATVKCYDPKGMESARRILGESIHYASSVPDCLAHADFCVIATPWEEFKKLDPSVFLKNMRRPVILDCWRILDRSSFLAHKDIEYLAVGTNNSGRGGKNASF